MTLPYCDKPHSGSCFDRQEQDDVTGLYPCNDGTQKAYWGSCYNALEVIQNNNDDSIITKTKTTTTHSTDCNTWSHALDLNQKPNAVDHELVKFAGN